MSRLLNLLRALTTPARRGSALNGFVDSLVQKFEDCRGGLSDAALEGDAEGVTRFFADLYDKEVPRLRRAIGIQESFLSPAQAERLFHEVDELVRRVVLPSYVRLARSHTRAERNDFYLVGQGLHGVERSLWAAGGILLGAFIVWAPFVPFWSKEIVLPLGVAGLFFPDLRRVLAMRRYEGEINRLVARTDREIERLDLAYLTSGTDHGEPAGAPTASTPAPPPLPEPGEDAVAEPGPERTRLRQGGD